MMGLAFLGIGLNPGPKSSLLGLMWGSLLFVDVMQLTIMAAVAALLTVAVFVFEKELKAILFSRELFFLYYEERYRDCLVYLLPRRES